MNHFSHLLVELDTSEVKGLLLYIIRHGETNGNLKGILQGWTDEPLNEKGRKLAEISARALADVKFDDVFSSPLLRAYETAEIIIKYNKKVEAGTTIKKDNRLKEMFFGDWEGCGIAKHNFSIPSDTFNLFYTDPFSFKNSPTGESINQVCERTRDFYQEIIHNPYYKNKTVLIATHGFALRAMLQQVYEDKKDFWHGKIPDNCAVNIIEVHNGVGKLVGDDLLFYDSMLCVNPYIPI